MIDIKLRYNIKKITYLIIKILLILLLVIPSYIVLAVLGTLFPINAPASKETQNIPIYISSNGFHTDLILPLRNQQFDWLAQIDTAIANKYVAYQYISLGWGDKGFYLGYLNNQTPTLSTTLKAIFLPTESLMHLTFHQDALKENENIKKYYLSEMQLANLITFIKKSFQKSENQKFIFYHKGYDDDDYFFQARGCYHLFDTCNEWTNRGLESMGMTASLWSPFA
ncbi:MAG: TIGR02117 family protein, partial [Thermoflexibacter sp.]|nr:TIGR02117 family protein [Thermoflexibacter sp.]